MQVNFLLPQKNAIHHLLLGPSAKKGAPSDGLSVHKKHKFEPCSGAAEPVKKKCLKCWTNQVHLDFFQKTKDQVTLT